MSKPSVLHVYKDYYPPILGGIEKCINWLCREMRGDFNTRVLVASRSRRFSDHDEDIQGVRVVQAGCWGRFLSSPIAPRYVHWLRRLDSDILHFHMPNPTAELAYLLARPPRGRVVVTYHSDIVRQRLTGALYRPLQRRFLEQVRVIMPTSRAYLNSSATLAEHRARCRVVPLGVRLDELDETDASRAFSSEIRQQAAGRCALVFIGLLRYYKGLPFLLRALAHLPAHSSCLFLAGTPPQGREHERRLLERMVGELGLGNRVFFLGALTDAQAVGLRRAGDIFCLPSHLRSEAFGLTQVEAMACGLPVVSTRLPGVADVNRDGETGRVAEPGDVESLCQSLVVLIENPDLRKQMGLAAEARARRYFSIERMARMVAQIYDDVLAGRSVLESQWDEPDPDLVSPV